MASGAGATIATATGGAPPAGACLLCFAHCFVRHARECLPGLGNLAGAATL